MSVYGECSLLSGGGLCGKPIARPEECGVSVCDLESSIMKQPRAA